MAEFNAQQHLDEEGYLVIVAAHQCKVGDVFEVDSPCWDGTKPLGKTVVVGEATRQDAQRELWRQNPERAWSEPPLGGHYFYKVIAE